jgi:hypothetical protein
MCMLPRYTLQSVVLPVDEHLERIREELPILERMALDAYVKGDDESFNRLAERVAKLEAELKGGGGKKSIAPHTLKIIILVFKVLA